MSENMRYILAAAIAVMQLYYYTPWHQNMFAVFWDYVAKTCGSIANLLAWIAVEARANYFACVQEA